MTDHSHEPGTGPNPEPTGEALIAAVRDAGDALRNEIARVIVGQDDVVDQILMSIFCDGHALLVGVPGLAKTLLVSTIARAMDLKFSRVQFTPDLMPSDITGTEVIEEDKTTGRRELRFVPGPVFANVVLADEINRTPPKTQAALLESMQERQVSVGGVRHPLPNPFFVLATQNPLEQEGTYPLPEAQLDRFMFQILIRYPSETEELEVVRRSARKDEVTIEPVIDAAKIAEVRRIVRHCPVPEHVLRYALRLVRCTRGGDDAPSVVRDYLAWGAGPRASEALVHAAKAHALLRGSGMVTAEDVRAVAHPVLRHRILTNFNAEADQVTTDAIVDVLLDEIPVSGEDPASSRLAGRVLREGA
ncbi:MAG: MoxR family ATPase [Phycisphaerales bacterium]|nr:MoxR family ATPase [Planctomycetota bacterium]MCH8508074.1 MoxR family ATPase [Phycisphaerales bacterium]